MSEELFPVGEPISYPLLMRNAMRAMIEAWYDARALRPHRGYASLRTHAMEKCTLAICGPRQSSHTTLAIELANAAERSALLTALPVVLPHISRAVKSDVVLASISQRRELVDVFSRVNPKLTLLVVDVADRLTPDQRSWLYSDEILAAFAGEPTYILLG